MSDDDITKPYLDQIATYRDTTRWIITSYSAVAAVIIAGSSLSGIASIEVGWRLFVAAAALLAALLCVAFILGSAVRVMVMKGVSPNDLASGNDYARHRDFLNKEIVPYLPPKYQTLVGFIDAYKAVRAQVLAGDQTADALLESLQKYLTQMLAITKMYSAQLAFEWLMQTLKVTIVPLAVILLACVWLVTPRKEAGQDLSSLEIKAVTLTAADIQAVRSVGVPDHCLLPSVLMVYYRKRPTDELDAITVPADRSCPSVHVVMRGETEVVSVIQKLPN